MNLPYLVVLPPIERIRGVRWPPDPPKAATNTQGIRLGEEETDPLNAVRHSS